MNEDQLSLAREDRLLDQTGWYRLLFAIAAFWAALMFISFLLISANLDDFEDLSVMDFPFGATCFFWAIAGLARAKLSHIETIRRYRHN